MISEGRLARGEVTADEVEGLRAGELLKKTDAILKSLKSTDDVKRFKASVEAGKAPEGLDSKLNRGAALKIQNYYTNHGGKGLLDTKLSEKPASTIFIGSVHNSSPLTLYLFKKIPYENSKLE